MLEVFAQCVTVV